MGKPGPDDYDWRPTCDLRYASDVSVLEQKFKRTVWVNQSYPTGAGCIQMAGYEETEYEWRPIQIKEKSA